MHSYNTSAHSQPPTPARFAWPRPGDDTPRLEWSCWLRLVAMQLERDYPGEPGRFLAAHVTALASQAEALYASDPQAHESLAHEAELAEQAWMAAIEAEVADGPGHWEPADPDMPDLGGWGGHPDAATDDAARRGWYACDPDGSSDTWLN